MANVDTFNSGFDSGYGKKVSNKKDKKSPSQKQFSGNLDPSAMKSFHQGGVVKKTGVYRLKKGEKVLTIAQQKSVGIKKSGGKNKASLRKRVASKRG